MIHGVACDHSDLAELVQYLHLHVRVYIAEKDVFGVLVGFWQMRNKTGQNIEIKLDRVPDIEVLMVPPTPVKGVSLLSFQSLKIHVVPRE